MAIVPAEWMPRAQMKRVICHWTAGPHRANDIDRAAYHLLVEFDGKLVRGKFPINFNETIIKSRGYAAHTLGTNTGSIGISCCSMLNCQKTPFRAGPRPMTEVQWNTMRKAVAELCRFYRIPVTPRTVLGHGEVQDTLGIKQKGKWDPMVLPWKPELSPAKVGELLRAGVAEHLAALGGPREAPAGFRGSPDAREAPPAVEEEEGFLAVRVRIGGREVEGLMVNEDLLVRRDDFPAARSGPGGEEEEEDATVELEGETYVNLRALGMYPEWDEEAEVFVAG